MDPDLINAGKQTVTAIPGKQYSLINQAFPFDQHYHSETIIISLVTLFNMIMKY